LNRPDVARFKRDELRRPRIEIFSDGEISALAGDREGIPPLPSSGIATSAGLSDVNCTEEDKRHDRLLSFFTTARQRQHAATQAQ